MTGVVDSGIVSVSFSESLSVEAASEVPSIKFLPILITAEMSSPLMRSRSDQSYAGLTAMIAAYPR